MVFDRAAGMESLRGWLRAGLEAEEMPPYVYTYPPKPAWRPAPGGVAPAGAWRGLSGSLNVYVHVPWCEMKCSFCNLFTARGHDAGGLVGYVESLLAELELACAAFDAAGARPGSLALSTIHLGGGTPTLLKAASIARLVEALRARFDLSADPEIAIEGAPGSVSPEHLAAIRAAGVTRMSLGVQSFDPADQARLGRSHEAGIAASRVEAALAAGFPNVNVDLILGVPGQALGTFLGNIDRAAALGAKTITLYPLVVRERTTFGRRRAGGRGGFQGGELKLAWYRRAVERLEAAGYARITQVLFARPGGGNRFEVSEFEGAHTLGLGAGARSYAPRCHYGSDDYFRPGHPGVVLEGYLETVGRGEIPARCAAALSDEEATRRAVILQLLHAPGIDRAAWGARFGAQPEASFAEALDALEVEGLLERDAARLALTREGLHHSSLVAALFYSAASLAAAAESAYS